MDLEEKLKTKKQVIVEQQAPWCPHCQHFLKAIDQLGWTLNTPSSDTFLAKLNCVKLDKLCTQEDIKQQPTIKVYFKENGKTMGNMISLEETSVDPAKILDQLSTNYDIEHDKARFDAQVPKDEDISKFQSTYDLKVDNFYQDIQLAVQEMSLQSLQSKNIKQSYQVLQDMQTLISQTFPKKNCRSDQSQLLQRFEPNSSPGMRQVRSSFKSMDNADAILANLKHISVCNKVLDRDTIQSQEFKQCKASILGKRGFTCGLWLLFHSILANAPADSFNADMCAHHPLSVVQHWLAEFFSCRECANNFRVEVQKTQSKRQHQDDFQVKQLCTLNQKESNLFLWQVHNNVNKRLAREEQQSGDFDPEFRKQQWPPLDKCPGCQDGDEWDEKQVFKWLKESQVEA